MNQLEESTGASIMGIGTAWPAHRIEQKDVSARLAQALEHEPDARRWAKRIFNQCGVETRYTCEPNLLEPVDSCRYLPFTNAEEVPTTSERMANTKLLLFHLVWRRPDRPFRMQTYPPRKLHISLR